RKTPFHFVCPLKPNTDPFGSSNIPASTFRSPEMISSNFLLFLLRRSLNHVCRVLFFLSWSIAKFNTLSLSISIGSLAWLVRFILQNTQVSPTPVGRPTPKRLTPGNRSYWVMLGGSSLSSGMLRKPPPNATDACPLGSTYFIGLLNA